MLRGEGIEAHGQIAHPDPFTAAMQAVHDERIDEIIDLDLPGRALGLAAPRPRRARCAKDTGLPVEHVVIAREREAVPVEP